MTKNRHVENFLKLNFFPFRRSEHFCVISKPQLEYYFVACQAPNGMELKHA